MKDSSIILISSLDTFVINNKINEITSKYPDAEIVKYDIENINIEEAITNIDTYNFLSNKKIIILENTYFLTANKGNDKVFQNIELFKKYLENPNKDNILIITCSKLDNKKNLVKTIKDKYIVYEEVEIDIKDIIKKELEDYKMDSITISYLITYLNNDKYRIINELNKLKLLKLEEKEITKEDIDNNCIKEIDDNLFKLSDAIINKNKKEAFETYQSILLKENDDTKILVTLANKFRLYYQVKQLVKENLTNEEIGEIIGSHPYPVKLAREKINRYRDEDLLKILDNLALIDINKKTGNLNKSNNLEMFLLTL